MPVAEGCVGPVDERLAASLRAGPALWRRLPIEWKTHSDFEVFAGLPAEVHPGAPIHLQQPDGVKVVGAVDAHPELDGEVPAPVEVGSPPESGLWVDLPATPQ